jgi:outer membrane protein TolC
MKMYKTAAMRNALFMFIFLSLGCQALKGQTDEINDSTNILIPTLNAVLDSAYLHSPLLREKQLDINILDENYKIEKKKWMDNVYFDGAANYGMFDQIVVGGATTPGTTNTGLLTSSEQMRYYGGLSLKLPLSLATKRKSQAKVQKFEKEQTELELTSAKEILKQTIISEYFQFKYTEESMKTFYSIYQTLKISYMKAEKDVVSGRMNLNEFAALASTVGKSKDDYYKSKYNFYTQYHKIKILAGINF